MRPSEQALVQYSWPKDAYQACHLRNWFSNTYLPTSWTCQAPAEGDLKACVKPPSGWYFVMATPGDSGAAPAAPSAQLSSLSWLCGDSRCCSIISKTSFSLSFVFTRCWGLYWAADSSVAMPPCLSSSAGQTLPFIISSSLVLAHSHSLPRASEAAWVRDLDLLLNSQTWSFACWGFPSLIYKELCGRCCYCHLIFSLPFILGNRPWLSLRQESAELNELTKLKLAVVMWLKQLISEMEAKIWCSTSTEAASKDITAWRRRILCLFLLLPSGCPDYECVG